MSTTGKKGRPALPEELRKVPVGISIYPEDASKLDIIAGNLGITKSSLIAMLLHERLRNWTGFNFTENFPNPDDYDGA